jgi:hypothetical protein
MACKLINHPGGEVNMASRIEIRNICTGKMETLKFPSSKAAFEVYWKLRDEGNPHLVIELISD